MARILLVDDDSDFTAATRTLLQDEAHDVETVGTLAEASGVLNRETFDMLFVDLSLPDGSGLELIQDDGPKAVIITGHPSIESAIRAVRGRVVDYLVKPLDKGQLIRSIESIATGPVDFRRQRSQSAQLTNMIGESVVMKSLYKSIAEYGPTDVTVLISGESGTGKDLVAQALHKTYNSDAQFVPVNCGAIPRELVASELFGHEKGSFTGAAAKRVGVFERARSGTVFLDEIGELPLDQQVTLLRVMETHSMLRVGGEKEIPMTARIIAATNKDLEKSVRDAKFREDLFFRLMVLPIHVPPLRDRNGDIVLLANYYLRQYAKEHGTPAEFSSGVMARLESYHWPGNVRELKHTILRAAILNRGKEKIDALPENFDHPPKWSDDSNSPRAGMSIREVEKTLIEKTLEHFDGNKKLTAEALGISLKTLYNRLCEYDDDGSVQ